MIYAGTINIPNSIKRKHIYEGYNETDIANDIKKEISLSELHGTKTDRLIIISAVGALNPRLRVGDLVMIEDLLTINYRSSYVGASFVDLSKPFDSELQRKLIHDHPGVKKGIHAFMRGPHYETFADKEALRRLGADIVGMSTTPEVIVANRLGLKCVALGLVTNLAFVKHSHEDVQEQVKMAMPTVVKILEELENHEKKEYRP